MLEVSISGLCLKKPLVLASGILGISPHFFKQIEKSVGAVTTKSIGPKPRKGNPNPTIIPLGYGVLNSMGLPNPGIEYFKDVIKKTKETLKIPLIVSVFGEKAEDYVLVASIAEEAGADAIELNLSCPHERTVSLFSESPDMAKGVTKEVSDTLRVPIFTKLSPTAADIGEIAYACEKAGASGITAINTQRCMKIDVELKKPVFKALYGGLSGPALHPLAVRCVFDVYRAVSIPIIGVGGVSSWRDAVELFLAGASVIGIGSAVSLRGLTVFDEIIEGLERYMKRHGFGKVGDLVGLAHGG
ncbi:MAG: dihydroorotate dehydrogenase [Candidatus Geothermarchaeales archaeon]